MNGVPELVSSNWDVAYKDGKYDQDGPIKFVGNIVDIIEKEGLKDGLGFYPGCGNGRNLLPLLDAGLQIEACDISEVAIDQLKARRKDIQATVSDFLTHTVSVKYDYLLSMQLFQHVNEHGTRPLFDKVIELLRPGGIFFLRVNSIHTQIVEDYSKIVGLDDGGFTVRYESGPKKGQYIHFYSAEEIHALTMDSFDVLMPLREEFIARADKTYWTQWETILIKR